jgi:hypothetical protein
VNTCRYISARKKARTIRNAERVLSDLAWFASDWKSMYPLVSVPVSSMEKVTRDATRK